MQVAAVRVQDRVLLVRSGNTSEDPVVIEAMSDAVTREVLTQFQAFANDLPPSLLAQALPHRPASVAKRIAEHFGGEMIGYTRPAGKPSEESVIA